MPEIPTIEPFQFIRSTAFSERVQLANKLNEVIDALNQIGTIDDLQTQIDAINSEISEIQTAIEDTNSDVSSLSNQVNTLVSEVNGLLKEVVNEVVLDAPEYGQVRVKVIHEDETETASNALQIPVIVDGGISLISGTTARSFKIRYITADGVTHTTNDFVIPEGGSGTDVTVTSVTILEGDTDNSFKFEVGLSDGSEIQSNSYPFPAASELTAATTTQLGGIKVGTHLSVTADGTLSVDMTEINTAAVASTVMFTADASKVTMHADSLAGSEFTKDIPQASQGGAGTIDQESYAKIAATEAKVNALTPSVSVNESVDPPTITVGINGKSATANLPSGGTGSGPTFTVLNNNLDTSTNNVAKFAEWVANAKIGDNIKILGTFGSTGQFINTFDMSVVARDDDAKSLLLIGTGTARILSTATGHNGYWIPITKMSIIFTQASYPTFSGTVCYDTSGDNTVDISFPFNMANKDTYVLLTSY